MADAAVPVPPVSWRWSSFARGAVYALPAMAVGLSSPLLGLALAVGVLPVAAFPLPARRRRRGALPLVGALSAASLLGGALLSAHPVAAVTTLFVLGVGAGLWARVAPIGRMATTFCLPLIGIGLSFDPGSAALAGGLIVSGSLYAGLVSLLWPEERPAVVPVASAPDRRWLLGYAFVLGAVGAIAALVGFALRLEHVGWVTGAALLVLRPVRSQLLLRSTGRAISVTAGALLAAVVGSVAAPSGVTAVAAGLAVAALAGTVGSRWYVAPAFTTFVVLTLILALPGEAPAARFVERVAETGIGVGIAVVLGIFVPAVVDRVRRA